MARRRTVPPLAVLLVLLVSTAARPCQAQPSNTTVTHHSRAVGGFTPTTVIVLVALVSAFVVLTLFSIYINRCAHPPSRAAAACPSRPAGSSSCRRRRPSGAPRAGRARQGGGGVVPDRGVRRREGARGGQVGPAARVRRVPRRVRGPRRAPGAPRLLPRFPPGLRRHVPALPRRPHRHRRASHSSRFLLLLLRGLRLRPDSGATAGGGARRAGGGRAGRRRARRGAPRRRFHARVRHELRRGAVPGVPLPADAVCHARAGPPHAAPAGARHEGACRGAQAPAGREPRRVPDGGVERTPGWLASFWRSVSWQLPSRTDQDAVEEHGGGNTKRVVPITGKPAECPSGSGDNKEKPEHDALNQV